MNESIASMNGIELEPSSVVMHLPPSISVAPSTQPRISIHIHQPHHDIATAFPLSSSTSSSTPSSSSSSSAAAAVAGAGSGGASSIRSLTPSPPPPLAAAAAAASLSPSSHRSHSREAVVENYESVVSSLLGSSPLNGLSDEEVNERHAAHGYNEVVEKRMHPIIKFVLYFIGPMAFLLEAAAILSGVLLQYTDMGIILALLIINAIIGFYEEHSAASALSRLRSSIPLSTTVRRHGAWTVLHVRELVPGDRVFVKLGDFVPADGVLVKVAGAMARKQEEMEDANEVLPTSNATNSQGGGGGQGTNGHVNATGSTSDLTASTATLITTMTASDHADHLQPPSVSLAINSSSNQNTDKFDMLLSSFSPSPQLDASSTTTTISSSSSSSSYLSVDQSSLTGESKPLHKRVGAELLSGSIVKEGEGELIVTKIGTETFAGRAAMLVANAPGSSRFKRILFKIGAICICLCAMCLAIIIGFAVSRSYSAGDIATFVLVLTVASIPIALPTVLSVTLAVGANQLRARDAIAQRLTAVEELSSLDILCCDKTGTLTQNRLSIDVPISIPSSSIPSHPPDEILLLASLACNWQMEGDVIDQCILRALGNESKERMKQEWEQRNLQPFDPVTKKMHAIVFDKKSNRLMNVCKGAPMAVFQLVEQSHSHRTAVSSTVSLHSSHSLDSAASPPPKQPVHPTATAVAAHPSSSSSSSSSTSSKRAVEEAESHSSDELQQLSTEFHRLIREIAGRGLRSLAVAAQVLHAPEAESTSCDDDDQAGVTTKSLPQPKVGEWQLIGVIPLFDPPRDDSARTIIELNKLGVAVKMITGDDSQIGMDTAKRLGMSTNFVHAHVLRQLSASTDPQDQQQLQRMVEEMDGMGESFPEDKHTVVRLLQSCKHVVGMTGDGANDAPALALANVGIAVSGATDAARSAADLILVSPGLTVIADAIKSARCIYQRMTVYTVYRLVATLQVLLVMTILITAYNTFLQPIQIIFMAIANDFVIIFIAYDNAMPSLYPVSWNFYRLIAKSLFCGLVQIGLAAVLIAFTNSILQYETNTMLTMVYMFLALEGSAVIFSIRCRGSLLTSAPSLRFAAALIGGELAALLFSAYGVAMTSIGWKVAGVELLYIFACVLIFDFCKQLYDKVDALVAGESADADTLALKPLDESSSAGTDNKKQENVQLSHQSVKVRQPTSSPNGHSHALSALGEKH